LATAKTRRVEIPIGTTTEGAVLSADISAFHRGLYAVGSSGAGKSEKIIQILAEIVTSGAPALVFDDAGRTFAELERVVAHYAYDLRRGMAAGWSDATKFRVLKQKVLDRFTLAFVGDSRPNHHGIDLLKPRVLPNGETETVAQVTIGLVKGYEAVFHRDIDTRQTFLQNLEYLGCALCAAGRPVTEASTLLLDPAYWPFLVREIDRLGIAHEDRNREYVARRVQRLRELLDLRFSTRNHVWGEHRPFPHRFEEQFGSTIRALRPLEPGYPIATFFETDTFDPTRVAFRDGVFLLSSDISDDLYRSTLNLLAYSFWERLLRYRLPQGGGR
jgi:hypothetical protein